MTNDNLVALNRNSLAYILKSDADVLSVERIEGAEALWKISYSLDGRQPVDMLVDNALNEIYVQILIQIDSDHIYEALSALGPFGVVGLAILDDMLFMRSGFYIDFSGMHAFTNGLRAAALGYLRYLEAIAE